MPRSRCDDWADLDDDALLDVRMADLPLAIEGTLAERLAQLARRARGARARVSRCTSTCRTSGSRRTAPPRSPSPSTWRIRGWPSSKRRRCSRSKGASTSGACASCGTRRATPSTTPSGCACGGSGARSSACRPSRIPSSTRRSRTARASSCTSTPGTRRATPTRTSPRPSRSG